MKIDINSCRICLQNVGVIPFFQNHEDEVVSEMISSLFNINLIYEETWPTTICTNCLENIKLCLLTKNIIVNSESMLSNLKCNSTVGKSAENLNHIKVEDEDRVVTPELIRLKAEELKIERFEDSSQDFEDEQCSGLQIVQVQSLTAFSRQAERIHEKIHSGIVLGQETKHGYARIKPKEFPAEQVYRNVCNLCNQIFSSSSSLNRHKIIHSGVKEHLCTHCGKEFALKEYLTRHVQLVHDTDNPKNIKCNICGKISINLTKSKAHLLSHTRSKSFPCKYCGWKFVHALTLRTHIKEKHLEVKGTVLGQETKHGYARIKPKKIPTEQFYRNVCDLCNQIFSSSSSLNRHKTIHSGVKEHLCTDCGKEFALKEYLTRHVQLVHDTDNPKNIKCNICGKISINLTKSKAHLLSHTRSKSFPCKYCGWKFVHALTLRTHIKEKHLEVKGDGI